MGGGYLPETIPQALGAASVLLASLNVFGGFIITQRMLDMFKRPTDPPEYPWLYAVPGVVFTGAFLAAASTGMAGLVQAGYLTSSLLCIGTSSPSDNFSTSNAQPQAASPVSHLNPPPDKATRSESSVSARVLSLPSLPSASLRPYSPNLELSLPLAGSSADGSDDASRGQNFLKRSLRSIRLWVWRRCLRVLEV